VSLVLVIQHAKCMRRIIVICSLSGSLAFFPHYFINGTFWRGKKSYWTWNMFWYPVQLLSETFLILRRNERDITKTYIRLHVKYPSFLSDFKEIEFSRQIFGKIMKCQISWSDGRKEGQTDMKLTVAFPCQITKLSPSTTFVYRFFTI